MVGRPKQPFWLVRHLQVLLKWTEVVLPVPATRRPDVRFPPRTEFLLMPSALQQRTNSRRS